MQRRFKVEGGEQTDQPNSQTCNARIELILVFLNTTSYHLGMCEPSLP